MDTIDINNEDHEIAEALEEYFFGPDASVGKKFIEKYEILELAGRGGKSVVFQARDTENQKIVACKLLLPQLIGDERNRKRFRQEAIAAKRLDHAHINSVIDFGLWNGQPFMIMEFLEGLSLDNLINREKQLTFDRAVPIFIQIASACHYAHSRNIIHRDLKPSNVVLINANGQHDFVKIIDFGIAKIISENTMAGTKLTKTGETLGSPLYMSPEQCMGQNVDNRSDIYSLGVLMYEVLTGKLPLKGPTALATMFKHVNEMPAKFGNLGNSVKLTRIVENIVFKCLAKSPKQRYQSMEELANAYAKISDMISNKF